MDKETRNHIQRATQDARRLLEDDFEHQLEGRFDILVDGSIADDPGSHLDARERILRVKLVEAIKDHQSNGLEANEAVLAYLREAAFTCLNRFVALKMLEARDLLQECVSKGEESSGFREFQGLAKGLAALPDHGYRLYIESLFDETGREVRVLFDRRDLSSVLWPRRQALLELLAIFNSTHLDDVWAEDETIGWVYQFFNGDEERTKMRAESQAPRNSRELAVRNQFFTPRYVVQFLTDNTLGRTWYEMMQGETKLASLDYLVRRPNEVFLVDGESAPDSEPDDSERSQEELLQQTVYVPFRAKKDPRDLRILDPACGSGHFLLYAFELLVSIYEEAWADAGAVAFTETGAPLRVDYGSIEELRHAMPELILRHNLHGVDIDPRAAQIAALALWMRAQRAYNQFDVGRAERPPITKTNIVVAEPMPGDAELVDEFAARLKPAVLGNLFKKMVEEMKLAGELGSLLKIEESIAKAVKDAAEMHRQGNLFAGKVESQEFWDTADEKIIAALASFAESAAGSAGIRRQLFSDDVAQGVAFIELMRKRFDTVLMNPPFGAPAIETTKRLRSDYPSAGGNLYSAFVLRAAAGLAKLGMVGAITDSTFLKQPTFQCFREALLSDHSLSLLFALGWEVLDANVQTAMYVTGARELSGEVVSLSVSHDSNKEIAIYRRLRLGEYYCISRGLLCQMPKSVLVPDIEPRVIQVLPGMNQLGQQADLPWGNGANDSEMLFRLRWEVPVEEVGTTWVWLANGGVPSPFYRENYLLCRARLANGESAFDAEFKAGRDKMYDASAKHVMGRPGLTYPKRSANLHFAALSVGHVVTPEGKGLFLESDNHDRLWYLCGLLNSSFVGNISQWLCGPHKQKGDVALLPLPDLPAAAQHGISALASDLSQQVRRYFYGTERSVEFQGLVGICGDVIKDLQELLHYRECQLETLRDLVARGLEQIDKLVIQSLPDDLKQLAIDGPLHNAVSKYWSEELYTALDVPNYILGIIFGRWKLGSPNGENSISLFQTPPKRPPASVLPNEQSKFPPLIVDDPGIDGDFSSLMLSMMRNIWGADADDMAAQIVKAGCESRNGTLALLSRTGALFEHHLKRYRSGRRKAPIYWQLATPSASYSVWCYYHRLTRDTFFRVANDFVTPKVDHEESKLNTFRQEAGSDASSSQRRSIDAQETFVAELRAFATEVTRIAPLWNPNLNDGVIINFAPLWRLVPQHKSWQKECKKVWDKLVKGDYDWAHLAMHLWPERVVPKCKDDRSLAIAHGLEDEFWFEGGDEKWKPRKVSENRVQELTSDRSSASVKSALESLLTAPTPSGSSRRKKTRRRSA